MSLVWEPFVSGGAMNLKCLPRPTGCAKIKNCLQSHCTKSTFAGTTYSSRCIICKKGYGPTEPFEYVMIHFNLSSNSALMTKLNTIWDAQAFGTTISLAQYKTYITTAYTALGLTESTAETNARNALTELDFTADKESVRWELVNLLEDKLKVDIQRSPWTAVTTIEAFKTTYAITKFDRVGLSTKCDAKII